MKRFNLSTILSHMLLTAVIFSILLSGCSSPTENNIIQTPAEIESEQTPTPLPVQPTQTPTSTPEPPGKIIVITNEQLNQQTLPNLESTISDMASSANYEYEFRSSWSLEELSSDWKIVVLMKYDDLLPQALGAAPDTKFIVFSESELNPGSNLNVILSDQDYAAFLAGYIAMIAAPDWRAAALITTNEPEGSQLETAFGNGSHYYCGICNSYYAPVKRFPLFSRISDPSNSAEWQPIVDGFDQIYVYLMYLGPGISSTEMVQYMSNLDKYIISAQPPPAETPERWVATVSFDYVSSLSNLWERLMTGEEGISTRAEVTLSDVNPGILTDGRMRVINETIDNLQNGYIYPLEVPIYE